MARLFARSISKGGLTLVAGSQARGNRDTIWPNESTGNGAVPHLHHRDPGSCGSISRWLIAARGRRNEIMFTGLIEEVGTVLGIHTTGPGRRFQIVAPRIAKQTKLGDSIAVNGCCLTVAAHQEDQLAFDLLEETLRCTNLKAARRDSRVNLERALSARARLGGHFVQGHIDCAAQILASEKHGPDQRIEIELPGDSAHYVARKGSIAVNGISLTIGDVSPRSFTVWIIPATREQTNLDTARAGDLVNLEFDLIAKYVERMLNRHVVSPPS
jgi:riboflavin synthase